MSAATAPAGTPVDAATPALLCEAFDVYRGLHAVVHVDRLGVQPGEIVAVEGGPGAGKSTLLRGLCGLEPTRGVVQLVGRDLSPLAPHHRSRAGLGLVAQHGRTAPRVTIAELLDLPWSLRRVVDRRRWRSPAPGPDAPWSLYDLADHLPGLDRVLHHTLADVGAWERQAVAIALALRGGPPIVLLDEPGSGLGDVSLERLRQSLRGIAATGVALVVATRSASLASELASRRTRLDQGKLVTDTVSTGSGSTVSAGSGGGG